METTSPQPQPVTSRADFIASLNRARSQSSRTVGILSVCALIAILLAQWVLWNKDSLFKHPKVYAVANPIQHIFTGNTLHLNAPALIRIDQHLITQTKPNTLHITGLLRNAGHIPVTPPQLRVVLENHQGKGIAARNFTVSEYLSETNLSHLEPGQRYTFNLTLQTPNPNTLGYRLSLR